MDFLKVILGGGLSLFGLFIIFCSYARQISNYRNRNRSDYSHSSPAPFVGPIFVIVGLNALSVDLSVWILLLFVLDPDTLIIVLSLPLLLQKLIRRS